MIMQAAPHNFIAREILKGLHASDLRNLAQKREITTSFMAAAYVHRVRSRVPAAARLSSACQWTHADHATVEDVHRLLTSHRLLQVDLQVCASEPRYHLRLYVPMHHADLGYMASRAMLPAPADWVNHSHADLTAIVLPEWSERLTLIDMENATSYILGSDYYGDIHNSVLRIVASQAQARGLLPLHAGSAELSARSRKTGSLNRSGLLFIGIGGAGKTALATHDYGLDPAAGEKATVRQDDRVILHPATGLVQGTEGQGLYVRTAGLNPQDRPRLWHAVNHEDAVLENVWFNADASIDYSNDVLTANGRAIAPLCRIPDFDGQVDMPRCTHVFFLVLEETTRIVKRLPAAEAASLLQGADAMEAAQPAADAPRLASLFQDFLQRNPDVQCFALSTGMIGRGDNARKVSLAESAGVVRDICREDLVP